MHPSQHIPVDPEARGLIFDCDGTLADSMHLHFSAWREAFAAVGEADPLPFIDQHKGMPAENIIRLYNEVHGTSLDPVQVARDKQQRAFELLLDVRPIPAVMTIAQRYHRKLPMAVASGSSGPNLERMLAVMGVAGLFDAILSGDDPVPPKPDPGLFLEAARLIGVEPRYCQVFEDGEPGLIAAQAAGMIATDVRPYLSS